MLKNLKDVSFEQAVEKMQSQPGQFAAIKDGEYQFQIVDASEDVTSGGYGVIKLKCKILGPQFTGRTVFHRITVHHEDSSKIAVKIGQTQLQTLCVANGKKGWPASPDDLIDWKFNAKLDYREYNGQWYEDLKYLSRYGQTSGQYGISAGYRAKAALDNPPEFGNTFNDDDIPF
jgi:hypothetical protein